jgi:hypothetical protein
MRIVASQNFDHSSVHFFEEIDSGFIPEQNIGFVNFIFKLWKKFTANGVTKFFLSSLSVACCNN